MGLDSGYGIGSLKPGVCTSTTRPASPFTGQMIFETDTNRVAVYTGSSWIVLADADTPSGLELVKTQTIGTAVSSVEVTDAFSSTYDNYKIVASGGTATASNYDGSIKFGSSVTGYNWQLLYGTYSTTSGATGGTNATSALYVFSVDGSNGMNANIEVQSPYLSKYTTFQAQMARSSIGGTTTGVHQVASSYTSFTLTIGSGTMTGGTIRVYGYRNS